MGKSLLRASMAIRAYLMCRIRADTTLVLRAPSLRDLTTDSRVDGILYLALSISATAAASTILYVSTGSVLFSLLSIPIGVMPSVAMWLFHCHRRRRLMDIQRPRLWLTIANAMLDLVPLHRSGDEAVDTHAHDLYSTLLKHRSRNIVMSDRDVALTLALGGMTTLRNRILVLSYLQLSLMAKAEYMRVKAIHDRDALDTRDLGMVDEWLAASRERRRHPVEMLRRAEG